MSAGTIDPNDVLSAFDEPMWPILDSAAMYRVNANQRRKIKKLGGTPRYFFINYKYVLASRRASCTRSSIQKRIRHKRGLRR